jgi:threonine synthase
MTVAVTQAKRIGARAVACASTGNTSASLSAYAAQAGIPSFVFVPEGRIAAGKLAQTVAYGARTLRIKGDFDDCLRLACEASEKLGVYLVNSVNPYRIEGQKTIVFELLQQLGWEAPDWIALPAGNLGNTSAFGKALVEAFHAGLIDRMPRLLAVPAPRHSRRRSCSGSPAASACRPKRAQQPSASATPPHGTAPSARSPPRTASWSP